MNYNLKNAKISKKQFYSETVKISVPISTYSGKNHNKDKFKFSFGPTRSAKYFFDVNKIEIDKNNIANINILIPKPTEKTTFFKVVQGKGSSVSAKIFANDLNNSIQTTTFFVDESYFVKELINQEHLEWAPTNIFAFELKNKDVIYLYQRANWINIYQNENGEKIYALHFVFGKDPFVKIKKYNEDKLSEEIYESGNIEVNDLFWKLKGIMLNSLDLLQLKPNFFEEYEIQTIYRDKKLLGANKND